MVEQKTINFENIVGSKHKDAPLHPSIKKEIKALLDMLYKFYDSKIDQPNVTEIDALEYIPLFTVNGALIASMLGVTYDEYLLATDYMIRILGLEEGYDEKKLPDK